MSSLRAHDELHIGNYIRENCCNKATSIVEGSVTLMFTKHLSCVSLEQFYHSLKICDNYMYCPKLIALGEQGF